MTQTVKTFLGRFKTPLNVRVKPGMVIRHENKLLTAYDLSGSILTLPLLIASRIC